MGQGKYSVIVSSRADEMLLRHVEFLSRVSIIAANSFIDAFEKAVQMIENNPYICSFDDSLDFQNEIYRKCLFFERYKILYCIEEHTVLLDAVVDCRQDIKRINFKH